MSTFNRYFLVLLYLLLVSVGCSKEESLTYPTNRCQGELVIDASIDGCITTKTSYDETNHIAVWKREDMVGVIAGYGNGEFTDTWMKPFRIENRNQAGKEFISNAIFSGELTDKGSQSYTYYVVSPYIPFQTVTDSPAVSSRLEERQFPDINSWDGSCDMMVAKPVNIISSSVSSKNLKVQFKRLFGILKLSIDTSITSIYGSEIVETISIESTNEEDILAGKYTIDLSSESPVPVFSSIDGECENKVTLDYRCKNTALSDIDAYFVLKNGAYPNVILTIKTQEHTLVLHRKNLIVDCGNITSAVVNWKDEDVVLSTSSILPKNPEELKVLTFGHSYVMDSMEQIDDLLNEKGITNVTFANTHRGNCSLDTYYDCLMDPQFEERQFTYYKRYFNGNTVTTLKTEKTAMEALCDEDWDIIVLQTSLENEGRYSKIAGPLQNMIDIIRETCQARYGKTPIFAWHMFWAMGSQYDSYRFDAYGRNQEQNYAAIQTAAKEVMRNHDIQLIIPSGTAVQSLRHSSMNNDYEFTRDWYHMDYGAGRYAVTCTWFEFFMKPCFGISAYGCSFMPPSYTNIKVTKQNREILQRAAVLACQHPFEISHLDEISPMDVAGTTESCYDHKDDEQSESFTLIDNLTW